jgi:hypothetical protein
VPEMTEGLATRVAEALSHRGDWTLCADFEKWRRGDPVARVNDSEVSKPSLRGAWEEATTMVQTNLNEMLRIDAVPAFENENEMMKVGNEIDAMGSRPLMPLLRDQYDDAIEAYTKLATAALVMVARLEMTQRAQGG